MKINLVNHDYQYVAEQMLFTLFPGERPVYEGEADSTVTLSLHRGPVWITATARLTWEGAVYRGTARAPAGDHVARSNLRWS